MQDLIDPNDPDWAKFQQGDEEWYLAVAGDALREYCGWHLWPSVTETMTKRMVESKGIITLPTRYVTDVSAVVMQGNNEPNANEPISVDPESYTWFPGGWIQLITPAPGGWGWGWPGAYYYGPDAPYYLPMYNFGLADVTLTHGYDVLPRDIKQVAFELSKTAQAMASTVPGNVKEVGSPQYKAVFGTAPGLTLNGDQKCRLANYRVGAFR